MQSSTDQQDPDQDQRKNSSMKDSTGMTIEFLRARLLSERSVSRTARQRADELAKRVVELEEQLKIVSLQRKKAERATADVLCILENHGISEVSEEFDSSSEQEITHCESKVGNNFPKEESSFGLKMRRNHMNEVSSSELESSPLSGRSLSWKSGKDSPHSHEKKHVDSYTRRQCTFASTTSASLKHRVGKSCRRIQRRDTRSTVEESQIDSSMLVHQDNGVATCSEGSSTFSDIGPENLRESSEKKDAEIEPEAPVSGDFENQRSVTNASNYLNSHGSDKDMERALEHQAQLIGQYEEEEKAQREWEEKFRENNNSTQDLCDPGNRSDVTEERDEAKAHAPPYHVATMASKDQDAKLVVEDICITKESSKSQSNGFQSPQHVDIGFLQDKKSTGMLAYESPALDFVFPMATGKQDRQHSENYSVLPSHSYHPPLCLEGPAGNQSAHIGPSRAGSSLCKEDTLGSKNEHYALITRETPDNLGSVLKALHHAKLSLKHKLNALPSIDGGSVGKALEYSVGERPGVPVGCAGLFRVPSDSHIEGTSKANVLGSNSRLSFTNSYPEAGSALTAGDRFITRLYTKSPSSVSTGDRHLINPTSVHMESRSNIPNWEPMQTWPRFSSHKQFIGPSLETALPFPSRYTYSDPNMDMGLASSRTCASPSSLFYSDVMPRMASTEGLRPFSNGGTGVPPASQFSFYDDHIRPNIYRL